MAGRRMTRPDHCSDCKRPLRSSHEPFAPGTVRHHGGGYCNGCHHRRTKGINADQVRRARSEYAGILARRHRLGIPEEGLAA